MKLVRENDPNPDPEGRRFRGPDFKWRCTVRDHLFVEPCSDLAEILAPAGAPKFLTGMYLEVMLDHTRPGHPEARSYVICFSRHNFAGGTTIAYCPMCGVRIDEMIRNETPEGEKAVPRPLRFPKKKRKDQL